MMSSDDAEIALSEIELTIAEVDAAVAQMRSAMAALNRTWCRGGHSRTEIAAMRAAGRRARRSTR